MTKTYCCEYSIRDSWWWTVNLSKTCRVLYQNKFEKYCIFLAFIVRIVSWYLSVCPSTDNLGSHWTNLHKISYLNIFRKICREAPTFYCNLARIKDTLHEDLCTFLIIGKTIPLQAWTVPEDSRRLRLPDF